MRDQEIERVVHRGKAGVHHLVRHEIGEDFLGPDVVEPAHGHQVAKPHMGGLVGDQVRPAQQIGQGRRFLQQQALGAVLDGANMLHTAEGEPRDQYKIKFAEGIRYCRVLLQPVQGLPVQRENGIDIACQLRGVGLPVQHGHCAPVHLPCDGLEVTGDKRKEV